MFALSRFFAFEPVAWRPAARFVRGRGIAAAIMAIAFAAAAASPTWAGDSQKVPDEQKKAAVAAPKPNLNADGTVPDAVAIAGVKTRVASAWDCLQPEQTPVVWARADHGTVSVKSVMGPGCSHPSMHLAGIFYTSQPGFKGTDKLYMLGFLTNGSNNINNVLTILVK